MFIAQGYASVRQEPFEARNVVATYIGVALYIVLYSGYTLYEKFILKKIGHFVPSSEVDFVTDAVWGPGDGDTIRARDLKEHEDKILNDTRPGLARVKLWVKRYVN